ncbi:hypothetical protein ACFV7O_14605 [Streptomyces tendae]|uniref:hypothetical protein n=1 Tax=Streptomyces tendae TaxID=1932 RepID=UPI00366464F1
MALTLDHAHPDPYAADARAETARVARLLPGLGPRRVVATGARYPLDPGRGHCPTLVCDEPDGRVGLPRRAVRVTAEPDAGRGPFRSGIRPPAVDAGTARRRMKSGVTQALEPRAQSGAPDPLGITLDVGRRVAAEPVDAAA